MADDPKKPNSLEDAGFEAIKNLGHKYQSKGPLDAQERQRLQLASEQIQGLEAFIKERPEIAKSKTITNSLQDSRETLNKLSPRVSLRRETHSERAVKETMATVEREFSEKSVSGQIRKTAETTGAQSRGISMAGKSQRELEKDRAGIMGQVGQLEEKVAGVAQNELYDKEGRQDPTALEEIRSGFRKKKALTTKAAGIEAALQKKRQEGTDDKSQDRSLLEVGKAAQKVMFKNQVTDELKSGQGMGAMNMPQLKEEETKQAKALTEALEKLKNSAGESAESIDSMREEAKEMADGLKKTQEAIKQSGGQSMDTGELKHRLVSMIPGLMNTAAAAAQESLINQPMQTLGNRLGYAQLSNAQYGNRNAAVNGDMTALLTASKDVGRTMSGVGENFKENAEIVRGINLASGALTTGLGAAQIVKGSAQQFNPLATAAGGAQVSEITSGVKTTVEGLAQATTAGTDLINQSSASTAKLGGEQSIYAINNEVNKVRGDFRQSFYDYSMGSRAATLATGGKQGREIMSDFAADTGQKGGMLDRLQQARIAPQEFTRMAAEGGMEQGSVFDTNQIFRARQLERSGVGTTDMNMQRMTQLASAGANNPQTAFASVLEVAFSKGLDSSKALNLMVQNTSEMVRSSAGATMLGLDTTKSAAERLGALTNQDMPNREMAVSRAATAEQKLNEINTGIGTNFSDMLTTTRMAKEGGVNTVTAMNLKKLDNSTADTLQEQLTDYQKMDKNAPGREKARAGLESALFKAGAGGFVDDKGEIKAEEASKALKIRGMSALAGGNFLNLVDPNTKGYDEFTQGKLSADNIKKDPQFRKLREQVSTAAATVGLTEDEIYAQTQRANGTSPVTEAGKAQARKAESGEGGSQALKDADEAATSGGSDMANKARLAAKELGGAAEALGKINKQIQSLVSNLNDKTSGNFQNAAADAASGFQNSANTFNTAAVTFRDSVNIFARIPTSTGDAIKGAVQPLIDKINTIVPGSGKTQKTGPRGG